MQAPVFRVADLNALCHELTPGKGWRNPHKSWIGLGNFDVNVIMRALQTKGMQLSWVDRRKGQNDGRARESGQSQSHGAGFPPLSLRSPVVILLARSLHSPSDLTLASIEADSAFGYIVNLPSSSFALFGAQHWISLRRFADGRWWLFDSSLKEARLVDDIVACLRDLIPKDSQRCQLLIVREEPKQPQQQQQRQQQPVQAQQEGPN